MRKSTSMNRLLLALSTSLLLASCQRELSINNPANTLITSGQDVLTALEQKQPAPQKFTVSNDSCNFIQGIKGTTLNIPAHAFVTQSGQLVTGNVTIELKEIYSVSEMVLNNKFTQVGGIPIESGGELFIKATQNSQQLKLATGVTLIANMPAQTNYSDMQVFNATTYDTLGNRFFSWQPNTNTATNSVTTSFDTASIRKYIMEFDSVGWINCDRFYNEQLVEPHVVIGNMITNEKPSVLIHLTGKYTVAQMYRNDDHYSIYVPEWPVTLIAFSKRDGKIFADFKAVQIQKDQTYTLTLREMSEDEVKQKLQALQ